MKLTPEGLHDEVRFLLQCLKTLGNTYPALYDAGYTKPVGERAERGAKNETSDPTGSIICNADTANMRRACDEATKHVLRARNELLGAIGHLSKAERASERRPTTPYSDGPPLISGAEYDEACAYQERRRARGER